MKSTDWVGNLISITLFSVLALASWGLSEMLQRSRMQEAPVAATGPNAIIDKARILRTDVNGRPVYRLDAERITHDEKADRSEFDQPVLKSLAAGRPKTLVRANTAVSTQHQDQIDLSGDVLITRDAFDTQPATRISTSRATFFIEEEKAVTDAPVYVQRGLSTLQGVGMRFDQKTQKIEIISESRMVVPQEGRK